MSGFTVISDISNAMTKLLAKNMVPEVILNADAIGLASPADKADLSLGVYLYDVSESEDIRVNGMISSDIGRQKFPPSYLTLNYMITAYSISDIKFRASEEYRILGRAYQILKDSPIIKYADLDIAANTDMADVRIELIKLAPEEKIKVWNFPNIPYKLSLFYRVTPVEISSTKSRSVSRVTDAAFEMHEKER